MPAAFAPTMLNAAIPENEREYRSADTDVEHARDRRKRGPPERRQGRISSTPLTAVVERNPR